VKRVGSDLVLDHGFVKLISKMGDDLTVVNAARISFNKRKEVLDDKDSRLIGYLMAHKHFSPMRHCQLTFHVKAPIFVMRQWDKHRIGSNLIGAEGGEINEISGRYVTLGEVDYYTPEIFRKQSDDNKQGSFGQVTEQQTAKYSYIKSIESALENYRRHLELGVAKEQARCMLPLAIYTEVWWTVSLQAALHFVTLRDEDHAQFEIREYARKLKQILLAEFPVTSSKYFEALN